MAGGLERRRSGLDTTTGRSPQRWVEVGPVGESRGTVPYDMAVADGRVVHTMAAPVTTLVGRMRHRGQGNATRNKGHSSRAVHPTHTSKASSPQPRHAALNAPPPALLPPTKTTHFHPPTHTHTHTHTTSRGHPSAQGRAGKTATATVTARSSSGNRPSRNSYRLNSSSGQYAQRQGGRKVAA